MSNVNQAVKSISKKPNKVFALVAMASGLAALPVAAFVNMILGLAMLSLPVLLIYQASSSE